MPVHARHQHLSRRLAVTFQAPSTINGDWCEFEADVTFCGLADADILLQASSSIIVQQNTVPADNAEVFSS
jgi:hypothetical protein